MKWQLTLEQPAPAATPIRVTVANCYSGQSPQCHMAQHPGNCRLGAKPVSAIKSSAPALKRSTCQAELSVCCGHRAQRKRFLPPCCSSRTSAGGKQGTSSPKDSSLGCGCAAAADAGPTQELGGRAGKSPVPCIQATRTLIQQDSTWEVITGQRLRHLTGLSLANYRLMRVPKSRRSRPWRAQSRRPVWVIKCPSRRSRKGPEALE